MLLQKLNNRKGFTLIEVIVVIVILAILAMVVVPMLAVIYSDSDSEPVQIMTQNEEKALEDKDETPKLQEPEVEKSKGDMNKL